MLGAIIGDLCGSTYEFSQITNCEPVKCNKLIRKDSFYSDDTVLTIAVADAIINKLDYGETLRKYIKKYNNQLPNFKPYFNSLFSKNLVKWATSNEIGESHGNGAMMRVSPVGYLFDTEKEVIENSKLVTMPSHNSIEAISGATTVALIIFYARQGLSKQQIKEKLNIKITKPNITKFNALCENTIDVCLYSLFKGKDFEDCVKTAISFGGDTDTNACIVGSMAEAFYPINNDIKKQAIEKILNEFKQVLKTAYKHTRNTQSKQMERI